MDMEFIYSTDTIALAEQNDILASKGHKANVERGIGELLTAVAYIRTGGAGFATDKDASKAYRVSTAHFSKAKTVVEHPMGLGALVERDKRGKFVVADADIVAMVVTFVEAHNKAVSGIYDALMGRTTKDGFDLLAYMVTGVAAARKRGIDDEAIMAALVTAIEG